MLFFSICFFFHHVYDACVLNFQPTKMVKGKQFEKSDKKAPKTQKSPRLIRLENMMFSKHWQITLRVIGITVLTIGFFAGIGYLIDQHLSSSPIATITGAILSYPIAQFIVYKTFKKITK